MLKKCTDVLFPREVLMKGVLKVSVEIVRMHGEKRSSNWSSVERCAESECAESETPIYYYCGVLLCGQIMTRINQPQHYKPQIKFN